MLAELGYPVIQPIFKSTEIGKQLLVYEVIEDESVFDAAWRIETKDASDLEALKAAQNRADDELLALYRKSFAPQYAESAAKSPIHQLFYHRLTGGRLERFYGEGTNMALPASVNPTSEVRQVHWRINGQEYHDSLNDIIEKAVRLLNPAQAGVSIIGHGDAHNGNVFFRKNDNPPSLLLASLLGEGIRRIHENASVSSLFV